VRILVFQTAYLGDVVLTTPLLSTLKKQFPDAYIACAIQPSWGPVLEHSDIVDEIIHFDKKGEQKGTLKTFAFANILKKKKFDVVLCPHPSFRSGLILWLSRIPKRIGFETSSGNFFFTEVLPHALADHEIFRVLSLSNALGVDRENWTEIPTIKPDPDVDVEKIMRTFGIDTNETGVIGLHPGSVWKTKRWLPAKFAEISGIIAKKGVSVLVFGTEKERELVTEVIDAAGKENVIPVIGLTLAELIAVISKLSLYITNDSGPMHIACALKIPVVAIFGSTVPAQGYSPVGNNYCVVQTDRLDCRPCGPHGHDQCPDEHFLCMNKVQVESVLTAASVIMGFFDGLGFLDAVNNKKSDKSRI